MGTMNTLSLLLSLYPYHILLSFITSYLSHPEDQYFFSGSMKSRSGSRVGVSGSFLDKNSLHNFCPDRYINFLKFLRMEISDWSGDFLSSGSASGSKSPDDWGRMFYLLNPFTFRSSLFLSSSTPVRNPAVNPKGVAVPMIISDNLRNLRFCFCNN